MADEISNHQLHVLLVEMNGNQKRILDKIGHFDEWRKAHEIEDAKTHQRQDDRISSIKQFLASVAVVSFVSGSVAGAIVKLKGWISL